MALVALSQHSEYSLANSKQDCRGWTVTDTAGTVLGTCTDMIVNTEAEHIEAIVLNTGNRIPAADITLQNGRVLTRSTSGMRDQTAATADRGVPAADGGREELTVPVVEERIKVGKRETQSGGVRVTQHVTEHPIEETVTLRDERVSVERHPVDAPAPPAALDAFRDGVFEITENGEEVVVTKQARVIEEVVVSKAVVERQEVVRDTVTRTEVEVQPLESDASSTPADAQFTGPRK